MKQKRIEKEKQNKQQNQFYLIRDQDPSLTDACCLHCEGNKVQNAFLGCESSQRPAEPTFQPKNIGLWDKNKNKIKQHQL